MGLWEKLTTPIGEQHPEWQEKANKKLDDMKAKSEAKKEELKKAEKDRQEKFQQEKIERNAEFEKKKAERKAESEKRKAELEQRTAERKVELEKKKAERKAESEKRKAELEKQRAERNGHYSQCPNCGGEKFTYQFIQVGQTQRTTGGYKKKSMAARTGNKAGRALANLTTLGMYGAVTSKRSDYKNVSNTTTSIQNVKMAICQDCGNSWEVK